MVELAAAVAAADYESRGDAARARRSEAAIFVLSDLVNSLLSLGLRPDRCSGDELRNAVSSLHVALANLGVGTPASVPSPSAEDPFALAVDWDGPAVVPRRLDEYPLFGLEFSEGHLPVVSPRGVAMLHCSFLCGPCAAAHALGSFNPSCYIHVLATMLCGVRCTWGPAGPPPVAPAPLPSALGATSSDDAAWLEAEHDRMVAEGKAETLSPEQALDPATCALIAPVRVAYRIGPLGAPPPSAETPLLAATARASAAAQSARIVSYGDSLPLAQAERFAADLATHGGTRKPRFVMGCHRTINLYTPPKHLRYATIHDAVASAPPDCIMRGTDARAAFYQMPLHPDDARYFGYMLPSGRIGRHRRCCFGGNAAPSAEAFLTAELKSVLRGSYSHGSHGGGVSPPPGDEAPDVGLGPLRKPPQIAALHSQRRSRIAAGLPPDSTSDSCYIVAGVLDDILEVVCKTYADSMVAWSRGVLKYASVTANLEKDFLSSEPEALGAHVLLATEGRATSVAPKAVKIQTTLEHCYLWLALAEREGGWAVPFKWLESLDGSIGWLAQFYRRVRLVRRPVGVLVYGARAAGNDLIVLTRDHPATAAVRRIVHLAESGALRPVRYFRTASLQQACLSVSSRGAPMTEADRDLHRRFASALQALGGTRTASEAEALLQVVSTSSDGSVDDSCAAWGLVYDEGDGPRALRGQVTSSTSDPIFSDEIEILPVLDFAELRFPSLRGSLVTVRSDNLGNCFRINKAKCSPDSPCFLLLDRIFELADLYDIELVALWCPRAANSLLDSLASLRSDAAFDAWCRTAGVRRA